MRDRCPRCGMRFEREEGFFVGAYLINFAIVEFALFVVLMGLIVVLSQDADASLKFPIILCGVPGGARPARHLSVVADDLVGHLTGDAPAGARRDRLGPGPPGRRARPRPSRTRRLAARRDAPDRRRFPPARAACVPRPGAPGRGRAAGGCAAARRPVRRGPGARPGRVRDHLRDRGHPAQPQGGAEGAVPRRRLPPRRRSVVAPPDGQDAFAQARERFLREARVLARFSHPGIVHVFEVFEEHGTAYLVLELLDGETLSQVLRTKGAPFSERAALDVAARVGGALTVIHRAGMLHRDVSPSNLVVTGSGRIVLIDFGLARAYDAEQTGSMTRIVTPGYAPPEQYLGSGRFGPASDVYGLAATLYRLLTAKVPLVRGRPPAGHPARAAAPAQPGGLEARQRRRDGRSRARRRPPAAVDRRVPRPHRHRGRVARRVRPGRSAATRRRRRPRRPTAARRSRAGPTRGASARARRRAPRPPPTPVPAPVPGRGLGTAARRPAPRSPTRPPTCRARWSAARSPAAGW